MARVVRFPADDVEGLDEEFLYHLNRGADLLARGEPESARTSLVRAAELRPRDAKALGLLGQACFRLGRYPDAADAYARLVDESPLEPGAQVNLGLAFLKAGRPTEAVIHLERALDLNPEHRRAMGYLGLAWLEQGNVARAREWFERAGREQMVARCDALLRAEAARTAAPSRPAAAAPLDGGGWTVVGPSQNGARAVIGDVEADVQEALDVLAPQQAPPRAQPPPPPARREAPRATPPAPPRAPATPLPAAAAPRVASSAPRPTPAPPAPTPAPAAVAAPRAPAPAPPAAVAPRAPTPAPAAAAVKAPAAAPARPAHAALDAFVPEPQDATATFTPGRLLQVAVRGEVLVRMVGLVAARGEIELEPEPKRHRGHALDEPFGVGRAAMQRARGDGTLLFAGERRRFSPVELGGGAAHFREEAVFAFDAALAFDNGRLAAPEAPEIELVRLAGHGAVLVGTRGALSAVDVDPERPVRVSAAALVGWAGALTPRLVPLAPDVDGVELSGEGRVLLDPGAALA
jgi:uncharacterized protein (AIM24 family)